jgi:two-component system, NtrC family, response regulator HydG
MTRRVLVVDDDRFMVKTLADVLRLKGWDVTTAYNGQDAVARLADAGVFDFVIMDVRMPGMDGVSAFRAMKRLQPDVRVVLMTAYAAHDLLGEAQRAGVLRIMPKPVDLEGLMSMLTGTLSRNEPVLIVDGDVAFLRTLSDTLRLTGYQTVTATTLAQALQFMTDRRPGAVLLHMHLGTTEPRDAVVAVHDVSPTVALVLYSGRPGAVDEMHRHIPGEWIHAYLQKPFAVDQLAGVLSAVGGG